MSKKKLRTSVAHFLADCFVIIARLTLGNQTWSEWQCDKWVNNQDRRLIKKRSSRLTFLRKYPQGVPGGEGAATIKYLLPIGLVAQSVIDLP